MPNSIPRLKEFLDIIDKEKTINIESASQEIALLSLLSAAQEMFTFIEVVERENLKRILEANSPSSVGELIAFFESNGCKDKYMEQVSEFTNYWTIDLMVTLYNNLSVEKRAALDNVFPEIGTMFTRSDFHK